MPTRSFIGQGEGKPRPYNDTMRVLPVIIVGATLAVALFMAALFMAALFMVALFMVALFAVTLRMSP